MSSIQENPLRQPRVFEKENFRFQVLEGMACHKVALLDILKTGQWPVGDIITIYKLIELYNI